MQRTKVFLKALAAGLALVALFAVCGRTEAQDISAIQQTFSQLIASAAAGIMDELQNNPEAAEGLAKWEQEGGKRRLFQEGPFENASETNIDVTALQKELFAILARKNPRWFAPSAEIPAMFSIEGAVKYEKVGNLEMFTILERAIDTASGVELFLWMAGKNDQR